MEIMMLVSVAVASFLTIEGNNPYWNADIIEGWGLQYTLNYQI